MIWVIVSLAFVLCLFFTLCLLVIGKRADQRKESLFSERYGDLREVEALSSMTPPARSKWRTWVSLHPQEKSF